MITNQGVRLGGRGIRLLVVGRLAAAALFVPVTACPK